VSFPGYITSPVTTDAHMLCSNGPPGGSYAPGAVPWNNTTLSQVQTLVGPTASDEKTNLTHLDMRKLTLLTVRHGGVSIDTAYTSRANPSRVGRFSAD
jgi:hypothetical protein